MGVKPIHPTGVKHMHGLHQGYSYEDLLAAYLMAENLHKDDFKIVLELKEVKSDLFDDVIMVIGNQKTKFQIKHTASNIKLDKKNFTNASSDLNLASLSQFILPDEKNVQYVIATNKTLNKDGFFHTSKSAGLFSFNTEIHSIDVDKLNASDKVNTSFLGNLTIHTALPNASFDLEKPGDLEKELLTTLRKKIGIGYYPNNHIAERDAAGRLILLANNIRGQKTKEFIDSKAIAKKIELRTEYGHVAQNFPFITKELRLQRNQTIKSLLECKEKSELVVLEGQPGSGKSHIFDDFSSLLSEQGVIVLKHFCYLEPTDTLAQDRVLSETMYGNFIHQLNEEIPEAKKKMSPYYAVTKENLEKVLNIVAESGKKVCLMIDGLDHLGRVVAQHKLQTDTVQKFLNSIIQISLPVKCFIFIASQPSKEIEEVIAKKNNSRVQLQPWDQKLIGEFLQRHNKLLQAEKQIDISSELVENIEKKTEGNALYLTYVANQIFSKKDSLSEFLNALPQLNSNLNNYYEFLINKTSENELPVIHTLALLDFSVLFEELLEMFPAIQRRSISLAIERITSILKPGINQSGLRIYHESFRRFVIERMQKDHNANFYGHIVSWLASEGFYESQRSYRYLIPYLTRSNNSDDLKKLIGADFIAKSLQYFHSSKSIEENLNKLASYFSHKQMWDKFCMVVELKRAFHTYSNEREDGADELYQQAILEVHGTKMFCERLEFDGKPVFSKKYGVKLCLAAEHRGGNPPWELYDVTGESMHIENDADVQRFQQVEQAHFLKLIRNLSLKEALAILKKMIARNPYIGSEKRQIKLLLQEFDIIFGVAHNYSELLSLKVSKKKLLCLKIVVAEYLLKSGEKQGVTTKIANEVLLSSKELDLIISAIRLGGNANLVSLKIDIIKLTEEVTKSRYSFSDTEKKNFNEWYQCLKILAYKDPLLLEKAKNQITYADGWYLAWIKYVIELTLIESSSENHRGKEKRLIEQLQTLSAYTYPFVGQPRACDLYGIINFSKDSFRRTIKLARNYVGFNEIINLLLKISKESTTFLQGTSGGPLDGESLNDLLKNSIKFLDKEKRIFVSHILEKNVIDGMATTVYYDASAIEHLKLASFFSSEGAKSKAKHHLETACVHLAAYGQRKDITLFEILESIPHLAIVDKKFAIDASKKSYPLVETVWRHTDGRETKWSLPHWIDSLVDVDIKIAVLTLSEMLTIDNGRDWRIEYSTEKMCSKLLSMDVDNELVADLYQSIKNEKDTDYNINIGLEIVASLIGKAKNKKAETLFNSICKTLYWLSVLKYVSRKENYSEIINFSTKYGLEISEEYFEHFDSKLDKEEVPSIPKSEEVKVAINFSNLSMTQIMELNDNHTADELLNLANAENLANRLVELNNDNNEQVTEFILQTVRNSLYREESTEGLETIQKVFSEKKFFDLAAKTSMLAFVYTRGDRGWLSLADDKFSHLGVNAFKLSRNVAELTLADELTYFFNRSEYFIGPTRHLIGLFARKLDKKMAKSIWNEAYEVIRFRLPAHEDLVNFLKDETPSIKYSTNKTIDILLKEYIEIRKKYHELISYI